MTETEQRIAIAEACGFNTVKEQVGGVFCFRDKDGRMIADLPDYLHDLNAMHEAEQTLTPKQEMVYVERLSAMLMGAAYENDPRWLKSELSSSDSTYRATASQRAEAFLKTKGLWK